MILGLTQVIDNTGQQPDALHHYLLAHMKVRCVLLKPHWPQHMAIERLDYQSGKRQKLWCIYKGLLC